VTLVELMIVLVIIGILAVIVGAGLTRPTNASAARGLAHKVWVATRSARTIATNTGSVVRIVFTTDGKAFTLSRNAVVGPLPTGAWITVSHGQATGSSKITCVHNQTKVTSAGTPWTDSTNCKLTGPRDLRFHPDGRVGELADPLGKLRGGTIYVQDGAAKYQHKIYIYKLTGFSRHVTNW